MKKRSRSASHQPTMVLHHVREIQLRLLGIAAISLLGMGLGYYFHEQLFAFIKAPLDAPLHYTSPAGSFTFIIKICLTLGVIVALPVAVYNAIMFAQPAFSKQLTRARTYFTTFMSVLLAGAGATFAFTVIIPLALRFFFKFQVDGLEAIISADEYLRFVLGVIVTFVLIFQLPLLISLIDHITPLPPKKLFKAEKYIIVGSMLIAVLVPFALDPVIQLLIASPIIVLYNVSIGIVLWQRHLRTRRARKAAAVQEAQEETEAETPVLAPAPAALTTVEPEVPRPARQPVTPAVAMASPKAPPRRPQRHTQQPARSLDGTLRRPRSSPAKPQMSAKKPAPQPATPPRSTGRLISDVAPASQSSLKLSPRPQ